MKTSNRILGSLTALMLGVISVNSCFKEPQVQRPNGKDIEKEPEVQPSQPPKAVFLDIPFNNSVSLRHYARLDTAYLYKWEGDKYGIGQDVDVFTIDFYTGEYIVGSAEVPDYIYFKDKGAEVCLRFVAPRYTKNTAVFAISSGTFNVSADPAPFVVLSGYVTEADRDGKTLDIPSYVFEQKSSNIKDSYFGFIDGGKMQVFFDDPVYTIVMDFKAGEEEIKYYFQGKVTFPASNEGSAGTKASSGRIYRGMPVMGNQYSKFLTLSAR